MAILVWNGVGVSRKLQVGVYKGIYRFNSECIRISREIREFKVYFVGVLIGSLSSDSF